MNDNSLSGITTITASCVIAAGSITTISGTISSTSGNIQTKDGTVGGKKGTFHHQYVSGVKDVTVPESRGIYLGLDSDAAGGIDMCRHKPIHLFYTNAE